MTQNQVPYDAGLHPTGYHVVARCNGVQVARLRGGTWVLRDDGTQSRVRDLKPVELDALVYDLARLVDQLRDDLVEVGKPGPLTLALGAGGEVRERG